MPVLMMTLSAPLAALQESIEQLRVSAEQGDADSSFELGVRYYLGNGVTLDYVEAMQWLTLALEQGDAGHRATSKHFTPATKASNRMTSRRYARQLNADMSFPNLISE